MPGPRLSPGSPLRCFLGERPSGEFEVWEEARSLQNLHRALPEQREAASSWAFLYTVIPPCCKCHSNQIGNRVKQNECKQKKTENEPVTAKETRNTEENKKKEETTERDDREETEKDKEETQKNAWETFGERTEKGEGQHKREAGGRQKKRN